MDVDGALRAIVGGKDYGFSQFNRATDALRQPGSSFKPFVYAAAMLADPKLRPASTVVDKPICLGNWCPQNYGRSFSGSMPLSSALARSINSIPVWMSLQIGKGNAKAGRAQIIDISRKMGLTHPLADSSSLPIGAAEVTVMDMAASYAVFANGGKKATPYVAWEVKNSAGEVIYRRATDTPPAQVLPTRLVQDMNFMLNKVVEEGTGKRSALPGIRSAGKTGTTNAYRDAWFVGYTGNMVAGVWYGNDDHSSMDNMTGGTLPAMTWQEVMAFGHQNLEIRPIPGLEGESPAKVASSPENQGAVATGTPPGYLAGTLSRRSYEVLGEIGSLFKAAGTVGPATGQAGDEPRATGSPQPRQVAMP
jgi:penicillin-binding protein 1A